MSAARPLLLLPVLVACVLGLAAPASADRVSDRAIAWAVAQDGHRETGTTNCSTRIKRWQRDMGLRLPPCRPWCGAFVHQAFLRAGVRLSSRLIDPARAVQDAITGRRGLRAIAASQVRPGDLLFFALRSGSAQASHIAIVRTRPRSGSVRTIEGNIGHHVRKRTRGLRYAVLAARVVR